MHLTPGPFPPRCHRRPHSCRVAIFHHCTVEFSCFLRLFGPLVVSGLFRPLYSLPFIHRFGMDKCLNGPSSNSSSPEKLMPDVGVDLLDLLDYFFHFRRVFDRFWPQWRPGGCVQWADE